MSEVSHLVCLNHYFRCFVNFSYIQNKLFVALRKKLGEIMFTNDHSNINSNVRIYEQIVWNSEEIFLERIQSSSDLNTKHLQREWTDVLNQNNCSCYVSSSFEYCNGTHFNMYWTCVRQSITKMVWRIFPEFKLCLICQFGHAAQLPIIVVLQIKVTAKYKCIIIWNTWIFGWPALALTHFPRWDAVLWCRWLKRVATPHSRNFNRYLTSFCLLFYA